jgi:hypothetical protein
MGMAILGNSKAILGAARDCTGQMAQTSVGLPHLCERSWHYVSLLVLVMVIGGAALGASVGGQKEDGGWD